MPKWTLGGVGSSFLTYFTYSAFVVVFYEECDSGEFDCSQWNDLCEHWNLRV